MSIFSECSASPQCHFSFFLSSAPWRLPQRGSLQRCAPGRLQWSPERKSSFSVNSPVTMSLSCVWGHCLPSETSNCKFSVVGERYCIFSKSLRISMFFFHDSVWAFELLAHKCHRIEILEDLLTVDLRKGKNWRGERFVRAVHCFNATDTGEMGNALFAVGWDFAFADNFHSFECCTSK